MDEVSEEAIVSLVQEAEQSICGSNLLSELDEARVFLLGKQGKLTLLFKKISDLSPEYKKEFGTKLNKARNSIREMIDEKKKQLEGEQLLKQLESEKIDISLPLSCPLPISTKGRLHPLTRICRELEQIFHGLGFQVVDGPEIECDYYNFEALNIPASHPARDMQDTFFTQDGDVLRTHTSAMQVRELQKLFREGKFPPFGIVGPGRCFRYEKVDASHEHTFYQMEGMLVDKNVSVDHLLYFMKTLLREVFGKEQEVRLRPGYFPFVEPGFELDISFHGKWLELLPCGLVHPRVLEYGGLNPSEWQGFAFGLGLSRLIMIHHSIDDIRYLQSGDLRFLSQFY